jgi:hypothetical protein
VAHAARYARIPLALASALALTGDTAAFAEHGIGLARVVFIDASRPTKASGSFPGAPERRLDTWITRPAIATTSRPTARTPTASGSRRTRASVRRPARSGAR